jgi:hypothetical protein
MIPAYEGKEPYIFVSYAHKDSAVVFRLVEQLNERGYRIWYDEGIEPGSEWPEYIANHLLGAEMVLSVLTPSAVNSVNCRREINFALSKNKPVLTIYMEDIELPVGLELQLSSQQSVLYYTYDSEERFLDKIETCQHLRPCKRAAGESGAAGSGAAAAQTGGSVSAKAADASAARGAASGRMGASGTSSAAGTTSGSGPSSAGAKLAPNKIALIAGACVAVLVIFFLINPGKKKNAEPENAVTATTVQDDTGSETQDDANAAAQNNAGSDAQNDANAASQTDAQAGTQNDASTQVADTTVQNNADTTADTTDEPAADTTAATWDYTITRSEESTTYAFDRGPRIVMPASWGSQVTVIDEGDHVTFYHTASREAWAVDGMDNAGYLFKLCLDPTQDYKVYPSFMDLGKTSEGYFFLMFPTDFQAYANNERILEQYQTLYNELDYVKINSYME